MSKSETPSGPSKRKPKNKSVSTAKKLKTAISPKAQWYTIYANNHLSLNLYPGLCDLVLNINKKSENTMNYSLKLPPLSSLKPPADTSQYGSHLNPIHINGVATQLKKENPFITSVHCITYRLHLAGQDAAREVSYFKEYENIYK
ncbi:hypothetical protein GLOIN_2v1849188 [Rhizophagus clarus]|uniref:Uncharacterized protein n=1 Tax=Rhizophagus clarus TaxID=94130 RepID=A0A8H3R4B0_9GLOM|nr:hypothetical protein GLOIN_2v1849188 [Rhizophagus clarus]